MSKALTGGQDMALAVSQNCMNKMSALIYHAGIVSTSIEGDLVLPRGCPLAWLGAATSRPSPYGYRAELRQVIFAMQGGTLHITGGAQATLTHNGADIASLGVDVTIPALVSLVSPGQRPQEAEEPQIQLALGQPVVQALVESLPRPLQSLATLIGQAVVEALIEHIHAIPLFPAFFRLGGYGVVLRSVEIGEEQLVVRAGLEWPKRATLTQIPFTLRPPSRPRAPLTRAVHSTAAVRSTASDGEFGAPATRSPARYRRLPPTVRAGEIRWPQQGPAYDVAVALHERPVRQILEQKFPLTFSHDFGTIGVGVAPLPLGRLDFTLDASFELMDGGEPSSHRDRIRLAATLRGENSSTAQLHCVAEAELAIEVALRAQRGKIKGELAAVQIRVKEARCVHRSSRAPVSSRKIVDWLTDQLGIKQALDAHLAERFGEPLAPLTFPVFRQKLNEALTVQTNLDQVQIVEQELQAWISVCEAQAGAWRWARADT